jgi:hypothetical protein
MFRLRAVLHASSWLGCFHLSLRFSMVYWLGSYFVSLDLRLGRTLFRGRLGSLYELRDAGFDGFVRRQFRFRVELEVTFGPVERGDHRVVTRPPVPLGVK